jgi:hypothetical protein
MPADHYFPSTRDLESLGLAVRCTGLGTASFAIRSVSRRFGQTLDASTEDGAGLFGRDPLLSCTHAAAAFGNELAFHLLRRAGYSPFQIDVAATGASPRPTQGRRSFGCP